MKSLINSQKWSISIVVPFILMLVLGMNVTSYALPVSQRTRQVRDAIVAAAGVNSANDVTAAHLAAITRLDLNSKSITSLKLGDFDLLSAMTELRLSSNDLTSLPSGIFDELTNLTTLRLDYNDLPSLPSGIFDELTNLTTLYLYKNDLSSLPSGIFDKLTNLTTLDLRYNQISDVSELEGLTSLTKLSLYRNLISDLGPLRRLKAANPGLNIDFDIYNNPPVFTEGTNTTRTVAENTASGQNIGSTVWATDRDGDKLFYYLGGTDARAFRLDRATGQLQTKDALDYETKISYTVIITVYDSNSLSVRGTHLLNANGDSIIVTINVTDDLLEDRTPQVRDAIAAAAGVISTNEVTEAHLAAITRLNVTGNRGFALSGLAGNWFSPHGNMTALKSGDFDGMSNLTSLDLSGNELSSLPTGIFDDLTELTSLDLFKNKLSSLPTGIFDKLTELETLDLSGNALSSLPAGLFDKLTNLTYLNLLDNPLQSLPDDYFDKLTKLETLFLPPYIKQPLLPGAGTITPVANRTPKVRDAIVAAVPGVTSAANITATQLAAISELDMTESKITALKSGDFDGLINMEGLGIGDTLSSLPDGIFDDLTRLEVLALGGTLPSLPDGIFDNLLNLKTLYISGTQLSSLPDGIFDNLTNMQTFGLINTQLTSLPDGIFDSFTNVPVIYLNDNQLSSLPAGIFDKATMRVFLQNNQLSSLPDGIFKGSFTKAPNLTGMELLGVPLGQIPDDRLDELGEYTLVYLNGNTIDPLPLTISLKRVANGQFKAVAPTGAPFKLVLPLRVANGSISGGATSITIPVGSVESQTFTVTRTPGTTYAVAVNIGTLPGLPKNHTGYTLVKSDGLVFTEFGGFLQVSERTPAVRDAIVHKVPGINSAANVTEAHLAAITDFNVVLRNSVKVGDFGGLTGLTDFALGTAITSLPDGLFKDLSNVTSMTWIDRDLTTLPNGVFDSFKSLTTLEMEAQSLTSLPAGVFNGITNLTVLSFYANQLSSLAAEVFAPLTNLTLLLFHTGQLTTLPDGVFDQLTKLTVLELHGTQLTSLPDGMFSGLTELTTVKLIGYTVNPMPLTVTLKKVENGQFKAVAPTGAPFDIVLPITVTNGSISGGATSITIAKGSTESGTLTITRTPSTTAAVTVNIGTLPGIPSGHSGYKLVKSTTGLPLTLAPPITNNAPVFTDGTSTTRTIAENTASGQNIGTAIGATDADNDTLTYTLGGTDSAFFSIVSASGQVQTKADLDYETKSSYSVTVSVSDGNGGTGSITVTINITDVTEAPTTPQQPTAPVESNYDYIQGPWLWMIAPGGNIDIDNLSEVSEGVITETQIAQNGVNEGDHFNDLQWTSGLLLPTTVCGILLCSSDNVINVVRKIGLTNSHQLSSYSAYALINISSPRDQNNVLMGIGSDDSVKVWLNGSVVYKNDTTRRTTGVQNRFNVNLSAGNNLLLVKVCNHSTLLVNNDWGMFFKLYLDTQDYTISLPIGNTIGQQNTTNTPPVFTDGVNTTRSIAENTPSGKHIGTAITATDADNDTLTYTLGGTDAVAFEIDVTTGQLKTKAALDYETKTTYTVTVTVSDGSLTDTITVTINVTNVDGLLGSMGVCQVGNVLAPGQSCTYPDTDAVFSVLANGKSQWNIPNLPPLFQWINQVSIGDSMSISTTINSVKFHFVAEETTGNSWEIKEIGNSGQQYPEKPKTGNTDDTPTLNLSTVSTLTEATLHEGVVTLTLSNGTFESRAFDIRSSLKVSGITDVDFDPFSIVRVSDTKATVELEFDGNMTTDGTLTFALNSDAIADYDGSALTSQISVSAVTESITASTTASLTESILDASVVTLTLSGRKFEQSTSTIRLSVSVSGISGVTVRRIDIDRKSDTEVTVELTYNGDMTSDGTLTFTVGKGAISGYDGSALTAQVSVSGGTETPVDTEPETPVVTEPETPQQPQQPQQPTQPGNTGGTPTLSLSTASTLTEATLHGAVVSLNLSSGTFEKAFWNLNDEISVSGITGVTYDDFFDVKRISASKVNIELSFDGNMTSNGTLTFTVASGAIVDYDGTDLTAQISVSAVTESITASTATSLTEAILDESVVTLNLSGRKFERLESIIRHAVTVSGISGVTVRSNGIDRQSDTEVTIKLNYDGDMTTDGTLTFTVGAAAIVDYNESFTVQLSVPAVSESIVASTAAALTEATLDESVVTLTLSGRKFEQYSSRIRSAVSVSGISGVTVRHHDIDRENDTEVSVELTYNGNMTSDGTLTFTVGADAIVGYTGPSLTAQLSVTAAGTIDLFANYPNPFNPETWIPYQLAKPSDVTITIYDMRGRVVRVLILGHQSAGVYRSRSKAAHWDGRNLFGEKVATGVYFYTLKAGDFSATRKMLIRK